VKCHDEEEDKETRRDKTREGAACAELTHLQTLFLARRQNTSNTTTFQFRSSQELATEFVQFYVLERTPGIPN